MIYLKRARNVIAIEIEGLQALCSALDNTFLELIKVIKNSQGKVILSGIGKSGYVAKKISSTLSSSGTSSIFLHPAEASHGDLGMIAKNDVVILFSNSGETQELNSIISYCKRSNIVLVGITRRIESSLYTTSDIKILLPNSPEATDIGVPTTSTTMMMAFGDALAVTLLYDKGFTEEDFRLLHPGGNIGIQLLKVYELMHKNEQIPLIHQNDSFTNMILEMTRKRMGCVGVVDDRSKLIGIITDGDLRRHLKLDFHKTQIRDFMTKNPLVVTSDILAINALSKMNDHLITVLFVVENSIPIGILHLHDLIKAGLS